MNQLAVVLFAVVLLASLLVFIDGQVARHRAARADKERDQARADVRALEERLARAKDQVEVEGRSLEADVDELRASGLFGGSDRDDDEREG